MMKFMIKNKTIIAKKTFHLLIIIIFNALLFMSMLLYTPFFKNARKIYVGSAITSTHYGWLATSFLSEEAIHSILKQKTSDIQFDNNANIVTVKNDNDDTIAFFTVNNENFDADVILVNNPKKIRIAYSKNNGTTLQELSELVEDNNSKIGINAGGLQARNSIPLGIIMSEGQLIYPNDELDICAIDKNGILIVGKYTYKQILSLNINEAVCFGPAIIKDGKALDVDGQGVRRRTVIGQKTDGSILLIVTRPNSKLGLGGASSEEIKSLMVKLGVINATNLDGGNSSCMYKDGNYLYTASHKRQLATAIIVK